MPQTWKPIPSLTAQQRYNLFDKVNLGDPDGCHLWDGTVNDAGYGIFMINRGRFRATRVIYFAVTGFDPEDSLLMHQCDNKLCVRFDHLALGTNEENMEEAKERGRFAVGTRNGAYTHPEKWKRGEEQKLSKLTNEKVIEARVLYSDGMKCEAVAQFLGVTLDIASKIIRGILWKHVGGPVVQGHLPKTGKREPYVKINQRIVNEVRSRKSHGDRVMEIASKLDISRASVYQILRGKGWQ